MDNFIKKMLAILFLVSLMAIGIARGSTPDFSTTSVFNQTIGPGTQELGRIIITKSPYIIATHDISDFNAYNFQQFDIIRWNGIGTIKIGREGVYEYPTTGGQYALSASGLYEYSLLSNESTKGTITARNADTSQITARIVSTIPVTATPSSISLTGTEA